MQVITLDNIASQRFQVTLDGQNVTLKVTYAEVGDSWYLSVFASDGSSLVKGRRMNSETKTLGEVLLPEFSGNFIPKSIATPHVEMDNAPWGVTHELVYYAATETIY